MKKILAALITISLLLSLTACAEEKEKSAHRDKPSRTEKTLEITTTTTTKATTEATTKTVTTTIPPDESSTGDVSYISAGDTLSFPYGHIDVTSNWGYYEENNLCKFISPDKKTEFNFIRYTGLQTDLVQTASMLMMTMELNADEAGYSLFMTTYNGCTLLVGVNENNLSDMLYGGTFIYTAFVDEENNCIQTVEGYCEDIYLTDSIEFEEFFIIYCSYHFHN